MSAPVWTALVDAASLAKALASDSPPVVLDARFDLGDPTAGHQSYIEARLPGARFADLDRDLAGPVRDDSGRHPLPDPRTLARQLGAWGVASGEPGTQVVVYDSASGAFAARCWWLLRWLGHRAVAVLDGGLAHWQAQALPLEHGPAAPSDVDPARFTAAANPEMCMELGALVHALATDEVLLTDARAAPRFAGDQEPIDPVAGHVPGAINHPFDRNLAADGRFHSPAHLRKTYLSLLGNRAPQQLVAMCGSGVTACHLLLGMAAADLPLGRLYAGSWSEWIRDPARPVAKGMT
ncbi:MAG: sulfurtransferase [Pseudomonadota bacterium]